jgi:hypothetical protein
MLPTQSVPSPSAGLSVDIPTLVSSQPILAEYEALVAELTLVRDNDAEGAWCRWLTKREARLRAALEAAATKDDLLSTDQVAEMIHRSPSRVRQLCESGVLRYERAGDSGPYAIYKSSVMSLINRNALKARRAA